VERRRSGAGISRPSHGFGNAVNRLGLPRPVKMRASRSPGQGGLRASRWTKPSRTAERFRGSGRGTTCASSRSLGTRKGSSGPSKRFFTPDHGTQTRTRSAYSLGQGRFQAPPDRTGCFTGRVNHELWLPAVQPPPRSSPRIPGIRGRTSFHEGCLNPSNLFRERCVLRGDHQREGVRRRT